MNIIDKAENYIREKGMFNGRGHVVIGLSGGADSVCLFHILHRLQARFGINLIAVSVHHGIRGEEADRDMEFCEELCNRYDVKLIKRYYDVISYAKDRGITCEEAGRILRYEAFREVAAEYSDAVIAVAHHMNDQAETVIFNMCRGSGLRGIRGMQAVNGDVVRPLLCITRQEIEEYMDSNKLRYCTDSTNLESDYSRNRIRNKVIPYLKDNINPAAVKNISGMADKVSEAEEYLQRVTQNAVNKYVRAENEGFLIRGLDIMDEYIAKRAIIETIGRAASGLKDITDKHVQDTVALIKALPGTSIDIRGDLRARREQDGVYIYRPEPEMEVEPLDIVVPSTVTLNNSGQIFDFSLIKWTNDKKISNEVYTKYFDYDKIKGNLRLRTREAGDYMVIDDLGHHKKLKDLFVDEKLPARKRAGVILLADGDHIMWIAGGRISAAYKIDEATTTVLKVTYGGKINGKS